MSPGRVSSAFATIAKSLEFTCPSPFTSPRQALGGVGLAVGVRVAVGVGVGVLVAVAVGV